MRQVTAVDGFRLAYDRAGRGPAAVLLHGWPGDRADYEEVAPLVAAAAEVITPDLRGFGESSSLIRLPGAGHFIPLERPHEFAAAVIAAC
jgi:pimeloyl-ACP methyl ester carboxylesterase